MPEGRHEKEDVMPGDVSCPHCGFTTNRRSQVREHNRTHAAQRGHPMTPEGRQDLAAVIAEMRAKAPSIAAERYGNVRAIRTLIVTWADRLALLLAEAPQVIEGPADRSIRE